ncbi:hypothetical protein TNCV_1527251, partial [Trichonephila clavipes]
VPTPHKLYDLHPDDPLMKAIVPEVHRLCCEIVEISFRLLPETSKISVQGLQLLSDVQQGLLPGGRGKSASPVRRIGKECRRSATVGQHRSRSRSPAAKCKLSEIFSRRSASFKISNPAARVNRSRSPSPAARVNRSRSRSPAARVNRSRSPAAAKVQIVQDQLQQFEVTLRVQDHQTDNTTGGIGSENLRFKDLPT